MLRALVAKYCKYEKLGISGRIKHVVSFSMCETQ